MKPLKERKEIRENIAYASWEKKEFTWKITNYTTDLDNETIM
jgi:hypothetical protein